MNIHHLVGVSEDLGFVFLDPGHLVDGGGDAGRLSGELVDVLAAVAANLFRGSAIEPQDAVAQRSALFVEGGEGLALVGDADCCDAAAVRRRGLGEHLPDGCAAGFPPVDRVVLVLVHCGGGSWMFCFAVCQMFPSASTTIAFVDVVDESIATTRGPSARYLFSVMMLLPHL